MTETEPLIPRLQPADYPDHTPVAFTEQLRRAAGARPEHVALIDGDQATTWAELFARVDRLRIKLAAAGIGRGSMVASLAENSAAHVVVYLAVVGIGACMVPLPGGAHPDTLGTMLRDSGAALLFHSPALAAAAQATATQTGEVELVEMDRLDGWRNERLPAPADRSTANLDDPFDMIYSSGTTGDPKGILHDHRFRLRQILRMSSYGLDQDAILTMSTPFYSNTTLVAVLPVLLNGGTVVVMRKFDASGFLALCARHRVSHAMLVPVQYDRILDAADFDRFDLSAFRVKLSTSAPFPARLKREVLRRWPGKLFEIYGMTEGGVSTVLDCGRFPDKLDSVGRPVEGAEVRILDDQGHELPRGEIGEVVGRSPTMMPGYHNAPAKTSEILWKSPQGEDFIRTGDMGRLDADGFLYLLDRRKDMILSGGFNIYAADLEQVLTRHDAVAEAAVIAIPSDAWGETPLGLVVLKPDAQVEAEALRDFANRQLGKTQRLSAVEIRTALPRSDIGKILKRELRAPYWEHADRTAE
ncbi:AMP-binding protein [uncultured Paracoccus sp.]|uniref:class I adenylate-forming enzyme family protein n=1 Tax=uncultured Paracoccus sp. TaxID=189685 RepID=UPI002617B93E|nr:AMP-binding protein [uncultured Paracoccus sp.]